MGDNTLMSTIWARHRMSNGKLDQEVSKSSALTTKELTHSKHRHSKQQLITWLDYAAARARVAEQIRLDALKPKPAPEPIYKSAPRPVYQQQQIQQEYTHPAPQQQYQPAPQPQWQPAPKPVEQYEPVPQWQPAPKPVEQYIEPATTPAPRRFFPPGQLAFKRDQRGYS